MALKKAMIIIDKGSSKEKVNVLFNPNEYSISEKNNFSAKAIPGTSSPIIQFVSGDAGTLNMELFFDTYEQAVDVRKYTNQISGLLKVDKDLHAPPVCRFVWGSLDFKGIIESVSQKFTMFHDSGIPVRATLNVSFKATESLKEQYQKIPRQSADRTKFRILKEGESLWMIASQEYEDAGLWREIAQANGIDNPLDLSTGMNLIIPRLE